jgi:abortive infection bacteriophage resistance protein
MKKNYSKIPLRIDEQIALLKSRNLSFSNEEKAHSYLNQISYYRLSAYFLPYQLQKDKFNKDVDFKKIIETYSFDRDLRLLVFDCIERIEIAIRTQITYCMSFFYNDSHWHDNKSLFIKPYYNRVGNLIDTFSDFQSIISKAKSGNTIANCIILLSFLNS